MLYGSEHTQALYDRGRAPKESFPFVEALMNDARLTGNDGRKRMRSLLGKEHEVNTLGGAGNKSVSVWRYVLQNDTVLPAPADMDITGLPTVYLLGPSAKRFFSIEATLPTTGPQAAVILAHVARTLDVTVSR